MDYAVLWQRRVVPSVIIQGYEHPITAPYIKIGIGLAQELEITSIRVQIWPQYCVAHIPHLSVAFFGISHQFGFDKGYVIQLSVL